MKKASKAIETIKTISLSELETVSGGHGRRIYAKHPGLQMASRAASTSGHYNDRE